MGRRFPAPLLVFRKPERYREILRLIESHPTPLTQAELVSKCREVIRKPDSGEAYSESYMKRRLGTVRQMGLYRVTEEEKVELMEVGRAWLRDDIDFTQFLWRSIKQWWVLHCKFPEGIEGLDRILRVLENHDNGGLKKGEIQQKLSEKHGYEYNYEGIRGYPELLCLLGAAEKSEDGGYRPTSDASTYLDRFRDAELPRQYERLLSREGAHVEEVPERVKRDLMKYYMYRESGGWGKQKTWYRTLWKDYIRKTARESDRVEPRLQRSERYTDRQSRRRDLYDEIDQKFSSIDHDRLGHVSMDVLRRMAAAESKQKALKIMLAAGGGVSRTDLESIYDEDRDSWKFQEDFSLYDWQDEVAEKWFRSDEDVGKRVQEGITEVVTGAGKTVMALEVIRRWCAENPEGVVTVVVPTRVLMHQWLTELVSKLNVPPERLGWAGGGHKDDFGGERRLLVSIVNSAVKDDHLERALEGVGDPPHLLVADECHRYLGDVFSNVFSYHRTASLGLSATPVTKGVDRRELPEEEQMLLNELGPIYYSLDYREGLDRGLIPRFEVVYVGFDLTPEERTSYDGLSQKVSNAVRDIEKFYGHRLRQLQGTYPQKLQTIAKKADGTPRPIAEYFQYTQQRRELIAGAVSRQAITLNLLKQAIHGGDKTIVFQERISQLEELVAPFERRGRVSRTGQLAEDASDRQELYERYPALKAVDKEIENLFHDAEYKPVMYHSGHSRQIWNDIAMEWFRDFGNVMLSVKALIEGVDVPNADIGLVRVSSGSVRQRIQTLGRVLRTGTDPTKSSRLYILFARNTVDEDIFEKIDWGQHLGEADIRYMLWEPREDYLTGDLVEMDTDDLPRPRPEPDFPDASELEPGDPYEGPRRGAQISVDAEGRPFEKTPAGRRFIQNEPIQEAAELVHRLKGGGRIMINDADHMLTVTPDGPVFLGQLEEGWDLDYVEEEERDLTSEEDFDFEDVFG